jgi:hypothetical protein
MRLRNSEPASFSSFFHSMEVTKSAAACAVDSDRTGCGGAGDGVVAGVVVRVG